MKAHKTKTDRQIITVTEWMKYLQLSRNTIKSRIKAYEEKGKKYIPQDILSILDFFKWLLNR